MRGPLWRAIALAAPALIMACGPSGPHASAELASVFAFAAYPNGTLIQEDAWGAAVGPFAMPATNGTREYQVTDPPRTVQAYYRSLAAKHGWEYTGPETFNPEQICSLSQGRYMVQVHVEDRPIGPDDVDGYPTEMPSADPRELKASPSPSPSPSPAPKDAPYRLRIEAHVWS